MMNDFSWKDLIRFFSRFDQTAGCWEWKGYLDDKGYGRFKMKNKTIRAHRASLLVHGIDLKDNHVLHHCDNARCVNPEHLYVGTNDDNVNDRIERRRYPNMNKEKCIKGHALSGSNLYVQRKTGYRYCIECQKIRSKNYYERKKDATNNHHARE